MMDPALKTVLITGVVELLMVPLIVFLLKRSVGRKLDKFDAKRDEARSERAENERRKAEQREAERAIILAIARTMLLDNFEKCMDKGYYTVEERSVYGALFKNYSDDGGNGVIAEIAPRIRALPMEPPKHKEDT